MATFAQECHVATNRRRRRQNKSSNMQANVFVGLQRTGPGETKRNETTQPVNSAAIRWFMRSHDRRPGWKTHPVTRMSGTYATCANVGEKTRLKTRPAPAKHWQRSKHEIYRDRWLCRTDGLTADSAAAADIRRLPVPEAARDGPQRSVRRCTGRAQRQPLAEPAAVVVASRRSEPSRRVDESTESNGQVGRAVLR